jgi:ribosomal protein L12E/L44/L45/RPP1/RPP2
VAIRAFGICFINPLAPTEDKEARTAEAEEEEKAGEEEEEESIDEENGDNTDFEFFPTSKKSHP